MSRSLFLPTHDLKENIARLERQDLAQRQMERPLLEDSFPKATFVRIKGLSNFWTDSQDNEGKSLKKTLEDMVAGFYAQEIPFAFIISGKEKQINIFWGIGTDSRLVVSEANLNDPLLLSRFLQGNLPHAQIEEVELPLLAKELSSFSCCTMMSGIPTPAEEDKSKEKVEGIERLIRALYGDKWAYLVLARSLDISAISTTFEVLTEETRRVKNTYLRKGSMEEDSHYLAKYYLELLEASLNKYKSGRIQGMWEVKVYFLATSQGTLQRGKGLLATIFSGEKSVPTPIRFHECLPPGRRESDPLLLNILNSPDLSILVQLPKEEFPGYALAPYVRFAVSLPEITKQKPVALGQVMDGGISTGNWFEIELSDLTKNVLVAGVPGSGKTNTCMFILDQLWRENQIPALVIEPSVKAEYRYLRGCEWGDDLRIFTLGNEAEAPFRLNPFEFQSGVSLQTHIDYLRSLFNASFAGLYAPMPYFLEEAIYQVYLDKGWDLVGSRNLRGKGSRSFPTLTDLYHKIDEVVGRAGYDRETTQNVRTALKVRLKSLMAGGKGLMLDTRESVGIEELLTWPTVLELGSIGDDEEKAFLMGALLIRIFEYRTSRINQYKEEGLKHITLIEEAHRLLKNIPSESGNIEASNIRGKAVETFCHFLAEVRALGEGVIICDQIPTKLAPDVIKNTNLKVLHRLVAEEDRRVVGATMNMKEEQIRAISTIGTGKAAVYAEGIEASFLVRIPKFKEYAISQNSTSQAEIRDHMEKVFYHQHPEMLLHYPQCRVCGNKGDCAPIRNLVLQAIEEHEFKEIFNGFSLSLVEGDGVVSGYLWLLQFLQRRLNIESLKEVAGPAYCAILHMLEISMEEKGRLYRVPFEGIDALICKFMNIVQVFGYQIQRGEEVKIDQELATRIFAFQSQYKQVCQKGIGPAIGCRRCQNICLYQYEIGYLVQDDILERDFDLAIRQAEPDKLWPTLAQVGLYAARRAIETKKNVTLRFAQGRLLSESERPEILNRLAFCFISQMSARQGYPSWEQERISRNVQLVLKEGFEEAEFHG